MKKSTATKEATSTSLKLQKENVKALAVKSGVQAGMPCVLHFSTIIHDVGP